MSQLLAECSELARQCSQEIRTAAHLLHPPLLDELGLPTALRWLVDGFTARSSIPVQFELPATSVRLEPDQELSLFRVVQEAPLEHSETLWQPVGARAPQDGT